MVVKALLFIVVMGGSLWGQVVLDANLTSTSQASDLVLTFDAPYEGNVVKGGEDQNLSFILTDTTIPEQKELSDTRLKKVLLSSDAVSGSLIITIDPFSPVSVVPAISKDKQTVRLRIVEKILPSQDLNMTENNGQPELGWRYSVVVAFMGVLLGILWFVKRRNFSNSEPKGGWLWGKKTDPFPFEILFSKGLDPKNRLVLFRLNGVKYLVLTGVNNVLVDRFDDEIVVESENDFDHILRQNEETLTKMLGSNTLSPFERYRQNAEN